MLEKFYENTSRLTLRWVLADATTGQTADAGAWADKTVQVVGTFGGATVTIEGSNDGTTWATLTEVGGDPLTFTAAGLRTIKENPAFIRASSTGGSASALEVYLSASIR